jgi:hypothetical protein
MSAGQSPDHGTRRWVSVLLRTAHVAAMGVILGGVFLGAGQGELRAAIWVTLASGALMMLLDILKDPKVLLQGSGLFVLAKLALLAVGFFVQPDQRFGWYLAAAVVASVGSHMPGRLRHFSVAGKWREDAG